MNFLETIVDRRKLAVEKAKERISIGKLKNLAAENKPRNDFEAAIRRTPHEQVKIIAEIKRASPSKGIFAANIDPAEVARDYRSGGASAISVLTEFDFFKGSTDDLRLVREAVPDVAILRKDFIVDDYQIYESAFIGADAILLIVAALDMKMLMDFIKISGEQSLGALVEVHNIDELDLALTAGAKIIGVNNRNLATFEVSPKVSEDLAREIPPEVVSISESGITDLAGIQAASAAGYHAVLIGEHFMKSKDRVSEVKKFAIGSSKFKSQNSNPQPKSENF